MQSKRVLLADVVIKLAVTSNQNGQINQVTKERF